ncbi:MULTISPECIES: hypothetical protein [unclassified Caulobacter]|uniref:hypothetical protein n=1 Tax=unclassified Caulobacter TaxID=2648921 RepID=UPI000B00CDD1|nr:MULTISPECIES: hypothetical protein [unclassified Caulobacter]
MTRDLGRVGGDQAGRSAGRRAGGVVAVLLLAIATPAAAFQQSVRPVTTAVPTVAAPTAAPAVAAPKTYAECLRSYVGRTNATAYCQRLFPDAAPAAATPSTTVPPATAPAPEPVDITPQLNKLIDSWQNRPKTPKPPADPLAVIPEIQAACAPYAGVPERWRRCTADAWRTAGMRGQPPLVLQTPPVVAPPPVVQPPPVQPPVVSKPPVQTPPTLTPKPVKPEPVRPKPVPVVEPESPPVAVVEPPPSPRPPPVAGAPATPVEAPPPAERPAIPIWLWLVALAAAAAGGFGLAKLLSRARAPSSRPSRVQAAPCTPDIALVADPGVVVLTPDGPPRAGMAVSLRIERAADDGEVRLVDYPTLETAP